MEEEKIMVESALSFGIPCYTGEIKIEYFNKLLAEWNPDTIIVFVFGQFFNKEIINYPQLGIYNFHPADLAHTYLQMDKPQATSKLINEAIKLSDIRENKNLFMYMNLLLSNINMNMNDYKNAYEYLEIARKMQSRFYQERINSQINEMSAKYETVKKENKIILLKKENKIQHLQLSSKNQLIISLLIGISVFIVLFVIILIIYRKRNIAYKQLVDKNLTLICENKSVLTSEIPSINGDEPDKYPQLQQLAIKFDTYIENEKPFLFSEINYDEICKKLNTNRAYISKAINAEYNKSFSEVLNHFRIKGFVKYTYDDSVFISAEEKPGAMKLFIDLSRIGSYNSYIDTYEISEFSLKYFSTFEIL